MWLIVIYISRITILITLPHCTLNASARHCLNRVCCSTETSELPVAKNCTQCFFWYCFLSSFLTVCQNEACNILFKSYELGATSTSWTLFDILHGLRAVLKMVRPITSASERFLVFFLNRLSEWSKWYTVEKISTRRIFYISVIFSNSLRFKSSFKCTKSQNSVF